MQDKQIQEPIKKVYAPPLVTDFGTLAEQTAAGAVTPSADGGTLSS